MGSVLRKTLLVTVAALALVGIVSAPSTAADNAVPSAFIDTPSSSVTWAVGDIINFSGHAIDPEDGTLPASALSWSLFLHHCSAPSICHVHSLQNFFGVASGSFTAPDHGYPTWLELTLTATDSGGLTSTASVRLDPKTVVLTFKSKPSGGDPSVPTVVVNGTTMKTPSSVTVVVGSTSTISAPSPQLINKSTYSFTSWSDGGAQNHLVTAPAVKATYTASYRKG